MIMCQCKFIKCNKCTPLVGGAGSGEAMHVGVYGTSLYRPPSLAVSLKLLHKIKSIGKQCLRAALFNIMKQKPSLGKQKS